MDAPRHRGIERSEVGREKERGGPEKKKHSCSHRKSPICFFLPGNTWFLDGLWGVLGSYDSHGLLGVHRRVHRVGAVRWPGRCHEVPGENERCQLNDRAVLPGGKPNWDSRTRVLKQEVPALNGG